MAGTSEIEKIITKGVDFLAQLLPLKAYLYFPLLSSVLVWAVRRAAEWEKRILSFEVWLDPGAVEVKPDAFVLDFFQNSAKLRDAYAPELRSKDLKSLRTAFAKLYPVLGLGDPFLQTIFKTELAHRDFRAIVRDFDPRLARARADIEAAPGESRLLEGLKTLGQEFLSLNLHLISEPQIQKMILRELQKKTGKKNA